MRCSSRPALATPSGLCRECAATAETAEPTPRDSPSQPAPATASFRPEAFPDPDSTATARPAPSTLGAGGTRPLPQAPAGYELVERLGGGGMGEVYLAREAASERLVAMKFVRHPGDPGAFDRFLVELRVLARLEHPHIVRVLSSDFLRADPFFTMEYLAGGSLARAVGGATVAVDEAVRVVRAVASAVAAAHAERVVHRDIKPSNILLTADGTPKVADFGLAKRLDEADPLTVASGALGTPGYMPPEQISRRNGEIGPWSDVYGLGATLYHLLTGRAPFVGETPTEIVSRVLTDFPDRPRALRPDVPAALEGIVSKCLEKDPNDRYQSAAELLADMDRFANGLKPQAPPLTPLRRVRRWVSWHRGRVFAGAAAVAVLAGAFALGSAYWPKPVPAVERNPAPADPDAAFLARAREALARGDSVTVLGPTGAPAYSRWRVGPGEVHPLKGEKPPFAIVARGYAFLELFPDPGIDRYTFSAQIQHVEAAGAVNTPPVPMLHTVGLYVAHDQHAGPDESRIHTFGVVTFSDFLPKDAKHAQLFYRDLILYERRLQPTIARPFPVGSAKREPGGFPGPWRQFDLTVTPDGVRVTCDKPFAAQDAAALRGRSDALQAWADQNTPGIPLAGWSSRRPLGVWVYGSCVAVRNVTITPLTPP